MSFTVTQPLPGLVHLDFDSFSRLGKALIRPQEFAESPKFQDKVFTTSEMKRYYKNFSGRVYDTFSGFNIPGHYVTRFFDEFPSITAAELEVKKLLDSLNLPERFYLIASAEKATKKESLKAGDHELSHALWYLNDTYREEQKVTIAQLPEEYRSSVYNRLLSWGIYGPSVIDDEVHAYLTTDSLSKISQRFRWHELPKEVENCHNELNARLLKVLGRN